MRIDSHHHFWNYDPTEYPWIGPEMSVLQRDFTATTLLDEIRGAGIDGVVSVQARQTVAETEWLLSLAARHDFIRGVVGWVPLAARDAGEILEGLVRSPWLKAVRHVVQDEPDDDFILGPDFNRGIEQLQRFGLVYDILIFARHLPQTIRFVDQHPEQPFVLDHIAKPTIRAAEFATDWAGQLRELARRDHVVCKFSGVVTEVRDATWSVDTLRPYWEVALEAFGSKRLMFGSDWPVCLLRSGYRDWVNTVHELVAELTDEEQADILGTTACRVYGL